jgi:23S rRNA (cytidine1920-2'-O)/16S rRNA (cytidine1409-2'-O)-methyltransferase
VKPGGHIVSLIKPQFEAGRKEAARGKGVVRDPKIHRRVLLDVLEFARDNSYQIKGLARSPVLGPKGNVEFLGWLAIKSSESAADLSLDELVSTVL